MNKVGWISQRCASPLGGSSSLPRLMRLEASALAVFCFALAMFVLMPAYDPDYFWHLQTGRWIAEHGALPTLDPYSFTRAGTPWVLHEWLFQALLYLVHDAAGTLGVRLLVALVVAATLAVSYRTVRRFLGPTPAVFLVVAAAIPFLSFVSPRPQILTFLLFAVYLDLLIGFLMNGRARQLIWLPVIMVFWVNGHAGYVLGVLLLGLMLGSLLLTQALGRPAFGNAAIRPLLWSLAATVAATVLNPYHFHHWLYPFQVASLESTRFIVEWGTPSLADPQFKVFLGLSLAYWLSQGFRERGASVVEWVWALAMSLLAFKAIRHVPMGALTLTPLLAMSLADGALARLQGVWETSPLRRFHVRLVGSSKPMAADTVYLVNWALLILTLLLGAAVFPSVLERQREQVSLIAGSKAVDFIKREGISGRVFNEYGFGGLMIYRLYPAQKVFIDGRTDLYGDDLMKEYRRILHGAEGWEQAFERHAIDYVVCSRSAAIRQLLLTRGDFTQVYQDENNAVLVKRIPRFERLIRQYGQPPA